VLVCRVSEGMVRLDLRRVDDTDHAVLAVLALCAVEPDRRRGVLDLVLESPVGNLLSVGCGDEATPHAVGQGRAGRAEGTLGNGVVLGPELEGDGVTLSSLDAVRLEDKLAGLGANGDRVVVSECGASQGSSSEDGREVHCDWVERGMRLARCSLEGIKE
jgi:hypothetical protein